MNHREAHVRINTKIIKNYLHKMTPAGLAVYVALKMHENRHTGRCDPAYQTIADITGLDRKTVIKYTDKLVSLGLITKQERFIDGRQTSNQYNFRVLPPLNKGGVCAPSPQDRVESSDPPPRSGGTVPPEPLPLEPVITKKQMNCRHKDIGRGAEGYTFCRICYVDMALFQSLYPEGVIFYPTSPD